MEELLKKLGIRDLGDLILERRLRWHGHVMRSSSMINRVRTMPIPAKRGPGRLFKTWDECINKDLTDYELTASDTQNRTQWRASVRKVSARDSQLASTSPHSRERPNEYGLPYRPAYPLQYKNKTGFD